MIVSLEETENITACLSGLMTETSASYVMLIERSGQTIAYQTSVDDESKQVLGALLAGSFASSREIAKVLREKDFRTLIQQGKYESIFAELVGDSWILVVIYHKPTTLGMVQIFSNRVVEKLAEIQIRVKKQSRSTKISVFSGMMKAGEVSDTVDLLFKDLAS